MKTVLSTIMLLCCFFAFAQTKSSHKKTPAPKADFKLYAERQGGIDYVFRFTSVDKSFIYVKEIWVGNICRQENIKLYAPVEEYGIFDYPKPAKPIDNSPHIPQEFEVKLLITCPDYGRGQGCMYQEVPPYPYKGRALIVYEKNGELKYQEVEHFVQKPAIIHDKRI